MAIHFRGRSIIDDGDGNSLFDSVVWSGHGSPEGVITGYFKGQLYTDEDTGTFYKFLGTLGTSTGWV